MRKDIEFQTEDGIKLRGWHYLPECGHVMVVGAIDRRVKCVVAQVPLASGHDNARRIIRADHLAGVQQMFADDRRARMAGKPPAMIPVVAEDPAAPRIGHGLSTTPAVRAS